MNGLLALSLCAVLLPSLSFASLGDSESTIATDQLTVRGHHKIDHSHPTFSVHQIESDEQTVQEYVSLSGTVFAITWRGLAMPNLEKLLGTYSNESPIEMDPPKGHHRAKRVVRTQHVVIEKFGHMRDVRGKAYLPHLLPEGVTPADITE